MPFYLIVVSCRAALLSCCLVCSLSAVRPKCSSSNGSGLLWILVEGDWSVKNPATLQTLWLLTQVKRFFSLYSMEYLGDFVYLELWSYERSDIVASNREYLTFKSRRLPTGIIDSQRSFEQSRLLISELSHFNLEKPSRFILIYALTSHWISLLLLYKSLTRPTLQL